MLELLAAVSRNPAVSCHNYDACWKSTARIVMGAPVFAALCMCRHAYSDYLIINLLLTSNTVCKLAELCR